MVDKQVLSRENIEKNKKISTAEGSLHFVEEGFGTEYVVPYALKLGATNSDIGVLSSLPTFLASIFQLVSAKISENVKSRKKLMAIVGTIDAMLFIPLFLVPLFTKSILLLTIIFSLHTIARQANVPVWNSLIGDVIPSRERAEFLAKRNKITLFVLIGSMTISGLILNYFTPENIWLGFAILFGIAMIGKLLSGWVKMKYIEPENIQSLHKKIGFMDFIIHVRNNDFGNYVIFRSALVFSMMIAGPFFAVYMLKNLGFSYIEFSIATLLNYAAMAVSYKYWAYYIEKYGNRTIMYVTGILVSANTIVWFMMGFFFQNTDYIFIAIIIAQVWSGFSWSGLELSCHNYMFQKTNHETRPRLFAYFNVLFGIATLVGGLIGSILASYLSTITSRTVSVILIIFIISSIIRFASVIIFLPKVKEPKPISGKEMRKLLLEAAVIRPVGSTMRTALNTYTHFEDSFESKINTEERKVESELEKEAKAIDKILKKIENNRKKKKKKGKSLNKNKRKKRK